MVHGFGDGIGGFFYKPYKGARDEGALGFAKGCGKGLTGIVIEPISSTHGSQLCLLVNLSTHPMTGAFGVFGYTGDGISKSLDRAIHGKTMKHVMASKQAEAEYLARNERISSANSDIVEAFSQRRALKA